MTQVDSADLDNLGRYIRNRRQTMGLTQTQMGERLGWLQERVSILENGKYGMPSLPALARLAIALEVPLTEILTAAGYSDEPGDRDTRSTAEQPNGVALLYTLQELVAIDAGTMRDTMDQAADLIAGVMGADKVDAFMFEPSTQSLVVIGSSNTAMGRKQHRLGMDRLPLANRGREVEVFETGEAYLTGDAKNDPGMLIGVSEGLNVQSFLAVPLVVGAERRGVLVAVSSQANQFHAEDIRFFQTVARWVGMVGHRAELMEQVQTDAVLTARRAGADELIDSLTHLSSRELTGIRRHIDSIASLTRSAGISNTEADTVAALEGIMRVERFIADLAEASELERGLRATATSVTDITQVVSDVVESLDETSSSIHLRAPEKLLVEIDSSRFTRAVESIVKHSVQRSPRGVPVIVNIDTAARDSGEWVTVSIQDEGSQIEPGSTSNVFRPFGAGGEDWTPDLSLYLARSIVEAHHGTLTAETPGIKGCIFRLSVPVRSSESA